MTTNVTNYWIPELGCWFGWLGYLGYLVGLSGMCGMCGMCGIGGLGGLAELNILGGLGVLGGLGCLGVVSGLSDRGEEMQKAGDAVCSKLLNQCYFFYLACIFSLFLGSKFCLYESFRFLQLCLGGFFINGFYW